MLSVCVSCSVMSDPLRPHGLYSLPDSSVYGISQARTLEWVAVPFSMVSSRPRDGTWVSYIAGGFFINSAIRKTQECGNTRIQFVLEGLTVSWSKVNKKYHQLW